MFELYFLVMVMTADLSWPLAASAIEPNASTVKPGRMTNEVFNAHISHPS